MKLTHRSTQTLNALLPSYLNNTLSAVEQRRVEEWLRCEPRARAEMEAWQRLRAIVHNQPSSLPSAAIKRRLMTRIQTAPKFSRAARWLPWTSGVVFAVIVSIVLWIILQPGIGLKWSVSDANMSSFRIYRAPSGSTDFSVVREIPAQPGIQEYTYIDTSLSLNPNYIYRVEGESSSLEASSPTITANAQEVMQNQLIILLISLITGLSSIILSRYWLEVRSGRLLHQLIG